MRIQRIVNIKTLTMILLFCAFTIKLQSQNNYSEKALTGRGDLQLIGDRVKLQPEVYEAFEKMRLAALKDSVHIEIASGYRSFKRQQLIWNEKYKKFINRGLSPNQSIKKILDYSTFPGTSRHHWGTDIDIYDGSVKAPKNVLNEINFNDGGVYERLKNWMDENSEKYGFSLVYTNNGHRKGIKYEPWHYSYKALSKNMLAEFLSIDFQKFIKTIDLLGKNEFELNYLELYFEEQIKDINPAFK